MLNKLQIMKTWADEYTITMTSELFDTFPKVLTSNALSGEPVWISEGVLYEDKWNGKLVKNIVDNWRRS